MFDPHVPPRRSPAADGCCGVRLLRCSPFFFLAVLLSLSSPVHAQDDPLSDVPQVTRTIAIQDARIVQAPGRVIERGTVVMHNGLISAVGADAAIPYDAEIIRGDSLTVYAGFIDGLSHAALRKDQASERPGGVNTADPPQDYAGIQPDRRARDFLNPAHESIAALRRVGFTAAHVVPEGRMLPGSGSIILLGGDEPADMVLRPDVSQFLQFTGAPGVYPATTIGIMAKLRQLYREADRRRRIELLHAENPVGMERPSFDPVHQALYSVLSRERPLFVLADGADSALDVHRALSLADELGISIALAGLSQGFEVVEKLKDAGIPLFVTLGLPEGEEEEEEEGDTTAVADTVRVVTPSATFLVSDHRTRSYQDIESEKENLEARRAMSRERYVANAALLHEAGLRFGVSTLGAEVKDIRKNIHEMVAAGLPEDAALAALTIDGARLLGVDRSLGSVENGKIANLVVTKGSYFDEKGEIRFVFVEGRKFEEEEKEEREKLGVVAGTWDLEIDSPDGPVEAVIELSVSGNEIEGRVTSSQLMRPADISDAALKGALLTFTINTSEYGAVKASFTVSGSTLAGTVDVPGTGILDTTGTKVPKN